MLYAAELNKTLDHTEGSVDVDMDDTLPFYPEILITVGKKFIIHCYDYNYNVMKMVSTYWKGMVTVAFWLKILQ